jgi:hypothetical protein
VQLFHNAAAASAIADRLVHKRPLIWITGALVRPGTARNSDPEDDAA